MSPFKDIVGTPEDYVRRRDEINQLYEELFADKDFDAITRRAARLLILVMIDDAHVTKYRSRILDVIGKLKSLGIKDDLDWIEEFVPQHYRK